MCFWSLLAQLSWTFFLQNTEGWPEVSDKKAATNSKVLSISQTITALDTLGTQEINQNPFTIVAKNAGCEFNRIDTKSIFNFWCHYKKDWSQKVRYTKILKDGMENFGFGPCQNQSISNRSSPSFSSSTISLIPLYIPCRLILQIYRKNLKSAIYFLLG